MRNWADNQRRFWIDKFKLPVLILTTIIMQWCSALNKDISNLVGFDKLWEPITDKANQSKNQYLETEKSQDKKMTVKDIQVSLENASPIIQNLINKTFPAKIARLEENGGSDLDIKKTYNIIRHLKIVYNQIEQCIILIKDKTFWAVDAHQEYNNISLELLMAGLIINSGKVSQLTSNHNRNSSEK